MIIIVIIIIIITITPVVDYIITSINVSVLYWIRNFVWTIYNFKFVISDLRNLRVMSFVWIKRHCGVLATFWGFGPTVRRSRFTPEPNVHSSVVLIELRRHVSIPERVPATYDSLSGPDERETYYNKYLAIISSTPVAVISVPQKGKTCVGGRAAFESATKGRCEGE